MKFVRLSRRALVCAATLVVSSALFLAPSAHASILDQEDCNPANEYCYKISYATYDPARFLVVFIGVDGQPQVVAAIEDDGNGVGNGAFVGRNDAYVGYGRDTNYWVLNACAVTCAHVSQWAGYFDSGTVVTLGPVGYSEYRDDFGRECQLSPVGDIPCLYQVGWAAPPYVPLLALLPELP